MSKVYRFCTECRGDDDLNQMLCCVSCGKKVHPECIGITLSSSLLLESYTCSYCEKNSDEKISRSNELVKKMSIVKLMHHYQLTARALFIKENIDTFSQFCSLQGLSASLIAKQYKNSMTIDENKFVDIDERPEFLMNAELRDYQVEGIQRINSWFLRGIGGILADEMGLGKTIQTIMFLASCKHKLGISGPHLVVTPLAVLQNWSNEFTKFAPTLSVKKIHGNQKERMSILNNEDVVNGKFDIYLTTYDIICIEEAFFSDTFTFASITIDEGHRIKNENNKLRAALNRIKSPFRLLLTGTPLQNNLHELFALLNYVLPEVFKSSQDFDEAAKINDDSLNRTFINKARELLENHMMLRRIKADVEKTLLPKIQCKISVGMTELQLKWYKNFITRNSGGNREYLRLLSQTQLTSILFQLRKVVNHPMQIYYKLIEMRRKEMNKEQELKYSGSEFGKINESLLEPAEGTPEWFLENELKNLKGEEFIKASGKMQILDRLLIRLKSQGSRVLIFSQYTETLDVLQEYMTYRFGAINEAFYRLDGSTHRVLRELNVRSFNDPNTKSFVYLLSTTAGGMGINLATADSVVLYDIAWNPQTDLQAQDRAHRIGQKKQVTVYKLFCENTFEEKVLQINERKMMLDTLVIGKHDNDIENIDDKSCSITELIEVL